MALAWGAPESLPAWRLAPPATQIASEHRVWQLVEPGATLDERCGVVPAQSTWNEAAHSALRAALEARPRPDGVVVPGPPPWTVRLSDEGVPASLSIDARGGDLTVCGGERKTWRFDVPVDDDAVLREQVASLVPQLQPTWQKLALPVSADPCTQPAWRALRTEHDPAAARRALDNTDARIQRGAPRKSAACFEESAALLEVVLLLLENRRDRARGELSVAVRSHPGHAGLKQMQAVFETLDRESPLLR